MKIPLHVVPPALYFIAFAILLNHISIADSKGVRVHTAKRIIRNVSHPLPKVMYKKNPKSQTFPRRPLHGMPSDIMKSSVTKRRIEIKEKQESTHPSQQTDPIQSTFDVGIERLFKFISEMFSEGFPENENPLDNLNIKAPAFLPSNFPFLKTFDFTNLIKLLNAPDDSDLEELVTDTVSQLVGIVGLNDLREWMGITLTYVLLGPSLIPLFLLPVALFGMLGLLVPLFLFNPPSKLNMDALGHDPVARKGVGKRRSLFPFSFPHASEIPQFAGLSGKASVNTSTAAAAAPTPPVSPPGLDSCVERFICQMTRFYRDNPVSQWLARRFNSTKVEWARFLQEFRDNDDDGNSSKLLLYSKEDCKKYSCPMLPFTT